MRINPLFLILLLCVERTWAAVPIGSVVLYSDGDVEKLIAVENGELHWEDDRKRRYVRSSNPAVPLLSRQSLK